MTPAQLKKQLYSIMPRGRFGYTLIDRKQLRTYEEALATNPHAGFFRTRRIKGKLRTEQLPFYHPPCPFTPAQIVMQTKFAQGILAYRQLSPAEKKFYRLWGAKYKLSCYAKFMSEYLKTH